MPYTGHSQPHRSSAHNVPVMSMVHHKDSCRKRTMQITCCITSMTIPDDRPLGVVALPHSAAFAPQ
eukprot:15125-Eustigmatos_ZCMA.PRE.1